MEIDYDFDGSLRLTEVVEDFFFSKSTGLYVFRHPRIVDAKLREAADALGIRVQASPEKWLVQVPLSDALRLLERLGSRALSLPEYFRVRQDAARAGDQHMLASLESDQFIEMLSTVFVRDRHMIHHPAVAGKLDFRGELREVSTPKGRYGWIHPDDIDLETGLPTRVSFQRDVFDDTMKYWDTHTDIGAAGFLMAVRGFVTSVGKISLDLGFPADAVSQKLTIRECRADRPEGVLSDQVLDEAKRVLAQYYRALADKSLTASPPPWWPELCSFLEARGPEIRSGSDVISQVLKEDVRDALGILWSGALARGERDLADTVRQAALRFSGLSATAATDQGFLDFLESRRTELERASREHGSIVFVMGHNNPDTDTVVSALAEAYRQHLLVGRESAFIPVVPGDRVPDEVCELLGPGLARQLLLTSAEIYQKASRAGRPEWIMVDHNVGPEQPDARAIIDHHFPSRVARSQPIPRRIVFAGSTTALVTARFYGLGLEVPPRLSGILLGATLMDTENRFPGKMTPLDVLIMDRLRAAAGGPDESAIYQRLMRPLITCQDADRLFVRDYKEDWGFFGFAVAKGIGILDAHRRPVVDRLLELARANNRARNLPLTLVKIVDYDQNAETIRRERMHPVFIDAASQEFRDAVRQAIETVIRHESPPGVQIASELDGIAYWGTGTQLSRKKLAPVLDVVVSAFNRYFYSPSAGFYFKRDFLLLTPEVEQVARRFGIKVHADPDGVVVGNPAELKFLLQELGYRAASAAEYFRAYFDALEVHDERMVAHLTSSRYLEMLDVIVEDKAALCVHPEIVRTERGYAYQGGERTSVQVPAGTPGLIDPRKIDRATGLPTVVEDPRQYGTGLWRYWSPDSDRAWALRSTIFAYDIPSLDLKFAFDEALPRLTIRPCVEVVRHPRVEVQVRGDKIAVRVDG